MLVCLNELESHATTSPWTGSELWGRCFMWVQFLDSNSTAILWNLSLATDSWTRSGCKLWNYPLCVIIEQAWLQVYEKKLVDKSCFCCQDAMQAFNNFSIDFYKNIKNSINITILQNSCGFLYILFKKVKFYKTPLKVFKIIWVLLHVLQYICICLSKAHLEKAHLV